MYEEVHEDFEPERNEVMTIRRIGNLEIDEDFDAQRHHWIAERVGWAIMALLLLAALLGLFGSGVLNHATTGDESAPLRLEYNYFGRYLAPMTLRVYLGPDMVHTGEARIWFNREYLEGAQVQHVIPHPERVEARLDRLIYVFRVLDTSQPIAVTFYVQPEQFGSFSGQVGLESGHALHFNQFIYP